MNHRYFFILLVLGIFAVGNLIPAGFVFGAMYQNINPTGDQTVAPGSANFESGEAVWVNNTFVVRTRFGGTGVSRPLQLYTGNNIGLYINSGGNIGIGTTDATSARLQVSGDIATNLGGRLSPIAGDIGAANIIYDTSITDARFRLNGYYGYRFDTNAGTVMIIKQGGNVGIGTTAPQTKLEVYGTEGAETTAGILRVSTPSHLEVLDMGVNTGYYGWIQARHNNLTTPYSLALNPIGGNVGIATTTPSYKLDVVGGGQFSQPIIVGTPTIAGHAATKSYVDSATVGQTGWTDGGANVYTTTITDNVGIGTTGPSDKLEVYTNSSNGSLVEQILVNGGTQSAAVSGSGQTIGFKHSLGYFGAIGGYSNGAGGIGIWSATSTGAPQVYVNSAGNVGIGTTSPGAKLDVYGTGATIRVIGVTTDDVKMVGGVDPALLGTTAATNLAFITNNVERVRIQQSTGNVGIGTTNPAYKLDVNGQVHSYSTVSSFVGMILENTSAGYSSAIQFKNNAGLSTFGQQGSSGNEIVTTGGIGYSTAISSPAGQAIQLAPAGSAAVTILSTGNVGIGTTSPGALLDVYNTGTSNPATSGTAEGAGLRARFGRDDGAVLDVGSNGASGIWINVANGTDLSLHYPLLLNPNGGNVGIGTTNPTVKLHVNGSFKAVSSGGTVQLDTSGSLIIDL